MTVLVGTDVITGGSASGTGNFGNLSTVRYAAAETGTGTTMYYYRPQTGGVSGVARLGVYDASGNLLAETGEITLSGTGWHSAALGSSVSITSGQNYHLALMSNGWTYVYYPPDGTGGDNESTRSQAATYGALPASVTHTSGTREQFDPLAIYVDGTAGGGGTAVPVFLHHLRTQGIS